MSRGEGVKGRKAKPEPWTTPLSQPLSLSAAAALGQAVLRGGLCPARLGCQAVSLVSARSLLVAVPSWDAQTSPDIAQCPPVANHRFT